MFRDQERLAKLRSTSVLLQEFPTVTPSLMCDPREESSNALVVAVLLVDTRLKCYFLLLWHIHKFVNILCFISPWNRSSK